MLFKLVFGVCILLGIAFFARYEYTVIYPLHEDPEEFARTYPVNVADPSQTTLKNFSCGSANRSGICYLSNRFPWSTLTYSEVTTKKCYNSDGTFAADRILLKDHVMRIFWLKATDCMSGLSVLVGPYRF